MAAISNEKMRLTRNLFFIGESDSRLKFVSDSVYSDQAVIRIVGVDLLTDALDVCIDRARISEVIVAPDL